LLVYSRISSGFFLKLFIGHTLSGLSRPGRRVPVLWQVSATGVPLGTLTIWIGTNVARKFPTRLAMIVV